MQGKEPGFEKEEIAEKEFPVEEQREGAGVEEKEEAEYGQIEVAKIEAEEFFAAKKYAEELKEITGQKYSQGGAMLFFAASSREAKKIMRRLDEGEISLSFRAKRYIREEAKKQGRNSEKDEVEDEEKLFLSGKEVKQFLQYQKMGYVIDKLSEETKELLKYDKDGAPEVFNLVSEDLQDVRKYLKEHKRDLSRKARDFLQAFIRVKKKMDETSQGNNIFSPM